MKKTLETEKGNISEIFDFIQKESGEVKLDKQQKIHALLMAEEAVVGLNNATREGEKIRVTVIRRWGNFYIKVASKGEEFNPLSDEFINQTTETGFSTETMSGGTEEQIRAMLLKSFESQLKFSRKGGENTITVTIVKSRYRMLRLTLGGMILGILLGIIFNNTLSADSISWINEKVLSTVTDIFMSMINIIIAPVVFLSIASSIAGFANLSELGRIGAKTMGFYMMTSILAIGVGLGLFFLFQPGDPSLAGNISEISLDITESAKNTELSILSTLKNIVPSNFFEPFLKSDMLQVIFLAVFFGITVSLLGDRVKHVRDILDELNEVFMKITTTFMKLIPLAAFCSMCATLSGSGLHSLASVFGIVGGIALSIFIMIFVYMILLLLFARVNPLIFLKKYLPTMMQVFTMASSSASVPINMTACEKQMGISPKVYSLTIPLGATVNMDGACIVYIFATLAFCNVFEVDITGSALATLILSILLLSIGTPGIPNAGIVMIAMLCGQVGVPVAAISLIMGIFPLLDMLVTANNCMGDMIGTFCVAKSEGFVDMEVYRGHS